MDVNMDVHFIDWNLHVSRCVSRHQSQPKEVRARLIGGESMMKIVENENAIITQKLQRIWYDDLKPLLKKHGYQIRGEIGGLEEDRCLTLSGHPGGFFQNGKSLVGLVQIRYHDGKLELVMHANSLRELHNAEAIAKLAERKLNMECVCVKRFS